MLLLLVGGVSEKPNQGAVAVFSTLPLHVICPCCRCHHAYANHCPSLLVCIDSHLAADCSNGRTMLMILYQYIYMYTPHRRLLRCSSGLCYSSAHTAFTHCRMCAGNTGVCRGNRTVLHASGPEGMRDWLWAPGGEVTQSITIAPKFETVYTVTGVHSSGCQVHSFCTHRYLYSQSWIVIVSLKMFPECVSHTIEHRLFLELFFSLNACFSYTVAYCDNVLDYTAMQCTTSVVTYSFTTTSYRRYYHATS
jgi:hypothetical protein